MSFWIFLLLFTIGGFIIALFNVALVIVYGIIVVVIMTVIEEWIKMNTPRGRKEIKNRQIKQKKIENEFGIIDYYDK